MKPTKDLLQPKVKKTKLHRKIGWSYYNCVVGNASRFYPVKKICIGCRKAEQVADRLCGDCRGFR
jgi:hypothetical protein